MSEQPRPTILVVDTDEDARKLMSAALANANFAVLEARGGMEGVSAMLRYDGKIALAVVEIKLPGINGLDLANQIGIERPETEILYVSSLTDSVAVESITRAKPDAVLAKPFTAEQLLERVQAVCSRKTAPSVQDNPMTAKCVINAPLLKENWVKMVWLPARGTKTISPAARRREWSIRDSSGPVDRHRVKADHFTGPFPRAK